MALKSEKNIQSVSRAVQILQCFENNEELGVTEISRLLGLHKSTAFGLITTLEADKLLEKSEVTGKYRLGLELFRLGTKVNANLRRIAVPYLERLVSLYQETVNLVVLDDLSVVYLEKVDSTRSMYINTVIGGKLPLHCTAVGKAILSGLPPAERQDKVERMDLCGLTNNTIRDKAKLLAYLESAALDGYAEESEELELGLTCVAAPLFNHLGKAFAAVSVSGPTSRMNAAFRQEICETLIVMTKEISRKLGHD